MVVGSHQFPLALTQTLWWRRGITRQTANGASFDWYLFLDSYLILEKKIMDLSLWNRASSPCPHTHSASYLVWIIILATSKHFGNKSDWRFQWPFLTEWRCLRTNQSWVGELICWGFPKHAEALKWITSSGRKQKIHNKILQMGNGWGTWVWYSWNAWVIISPGNWRITMHKENTSLFWG